MNIKLQSLPDIDWACMPRDNKKSVVFISCDGNYLLQHGQYLARSLEKNSSGQCLHIHVLLAHDKSKQMITQLEQSLKQTTLSFSWEYSQLLLELTQTPPLFRAYCAHSRFLRLAEFIQKTRCNTLCLDADSLIINDINDINSWKNNSDVRFFPRFEQPEEHFKVAIGALFIQANEAGYSFISNMAQMIRETWEGKNEQNLSWYLDQISCYRTYQQLKNDITYQALDSSWLDWNFDNNSKIWTGKGERKFKAQRYVEYKQKLIP